MFAQARCVATALFMLLFSMSIAFAQQSAPQQGRRAFAQQELDQMLAPIALYPDALLSQILMASTYPVEVVEAARWSRSNQDLAGDRAVRAVERMDWDPSVKSLVAFPQILGMLDEKLNWTEDLGDAFLDQQTQVMDTVQYLRQKAYAAGNLRSSDQYRVDYEGSTFSVTLANPEIVYLPYYNPLVVYGAWWWPTHQPVYWAPWPGYYTRPGHARGFAWGAGIPVARGFFYCTPDWQRRSVNIVNVNTYYYRPVYVNRQTEITHNVSVMNSASNVWQHDTAHRRDAPYRDAAWRQTAAHAAAAPDVRHKSREHGPREMNGHGTHANTPAPAVAAQPDTRNGQGHAAAPEARHEFREHGSREMNGRGTHANAPAPAVDAQPDTRNPQNHAAVPAAVSRPTVEQRPHVMHAPEGVARGNDARRHDPSAFEGRGAAGNRADARGDAGGRAAVGVPHMVAAIPARPAMERAPVVTPVAPIVQPAVSRPNVEQRPAAAAAPVTVAHRAEVPNANARERPAHHAAPSGESTATPGNAPPSAVRR